MRPRPDYQSLQVGVDHQVAEQTLSAFCGCLPRVIGYSKRAVWRRTLHYLLTWGVREFGATAAMQTVRQVQANLANEVTQ